MFLHTYFSLLMLHFLGSFSLDIPKNYGRRIDNRYWRWTKSILNAGFTQHLVTFFSTGKLSENIWDEILFYVEPDD